MGSKCNTNVVAVKKGRVTFLVDEPLMPLVPEFENYHYMPYRAESENQIFRNASLWVEGDDKAEIKTAYCFTKGVPMEQTFKLKLGELSNYANTIFKASVYKTKLPTCCSDDQYLMRFQPEQTVARVMMAHVSETPRPELPDLKKKYTREMKMGETTLSFAPRVGNRERLFYPLEKMGILINKTPFILWKTENGELCGWERADDFKTLEYPRYATKGGGYVAAPGVFDGMKHFIPPYDFDKILVEIGASHLSSWALNL